MRSHALVFAVSCAACVSDAPPSGMTVNGTVIDEFGQPIANANVQIGSTSTKTDAAGKFALPAPATYDVAIVTPSPITTSGKKVAAFEGFTTSSPFFQLTQGATHTAMVSITVMPWASWVANERLYVSLVPMEGASIAEVLGVDNKIGLTSQNGAGPTFTVPITWTGHNGISGTAIALRTKADPMTGLPTTPELYGTGSFSTIMDVGAGSTTLTLTAFTPTSGGATIDANGSTLSELELLVRTTATTKSYFDILSASVPAAGPITFPLLPPLAGALHVSGTTATAFNRAWLVGLNGPTSPTLKLPDSITAMSPAAMATGIDSTTSFTWSAVTGCFYDLHVACGTTYDIDVVTLGTSARVPDTNALGSTLPPGASCTWQVKALSGSTQESEIGGAAGWLHFVGPRGGANGWVTASKSRPFTSK